MTIETFDQVLPQGIRLACRAAGARGVSQRVLLLHGFPEAAFVWDEVMQSLAPAVRSVAPNLRGYAGSSAPSEVAAYRTHQLVADVEALIDVLGAPIDLLVAHDWGGALAWALAAQRPDLLRRMLIVNSPHPAIFLRELRDNPAQRTASAYMNFLCRDDAAALLAADDFARLWPFFDRMGGAAWLDEAMRERYREVWRQGLDGALNYYRASPLRAPRGSDDEIPDRAPPRDELVIRVPTTVLWGEDDIALLPVLLDGLADIVAPLDVRRVSGASHWIVHEQPALLAGTIRELLLRPPRTGP